MIRRLQLLIAVIIGLLLVSGCTSEPEVTATRLMETAASDENFNAGETVARFDQYCTEHRNVRRATTISGLSETQIDFVNSHFDAVITSVLDDQVREQIQGPMLLLYRSIQGAWEEYKQFDWTHIEANENMFLHNSNSAHPNNRILTIWNSWLMDGNDLVDKNAPDAMNHWINYYTVTASEQVYSHDYDGLFIDSAGHKIGAGAVHRLMPDGYSDNDWRDGRYAALEFIKSYFPDKFVVFNGLHSGNGAEASLALTDGGLWETFAFRPSDSTYKGEDEWKEVIELVERSECSP